MAKGSLFKTLTALLTAAALFFCGGISVYAEESEYADVDQVYSKNGNEIVYISQDQFLYNFKGQNPGVTICGYAGESTTLNIPHLINGREVSEIDEEAFKGDENVETVIFPHSIKTLGENSFCGCPNLVTVTLASGVKDLYKVFNDCPKLESMIFPQGVNSIRESFKNCDSISYVKFSRSVTSIGEYSFSDCVSLRRIEWLGGIIKLSNAFDGCTSLESVTIPEGVVLIDGAFDDCTGLKEIILPQSLLYITGGFTSCSSLTKLELPGKVLFVNEAFNNCENLSKLKYSESTTISETAFLKCPKLVLEKDHDFLGKLLGWSAIILIMALAGYVTFRLLTVMADNLKREKAREEKAARKPS